MRAVTTLSVLALLALAAGVLAAPAPGSVGARTRVCEVSAVARDFYYEAPQHFFQCEDAETGEQVELNFAPGQHKDIRTGDIAEVEGDDDGKAMNVRAYTVRSRNNGNGNGNGNGRERRATTTRSAMVLVLRFLNTATNTFVGAALDTPAERATIANSVNSTLFGVYDSAVKATHAGMWNDCSYGALSLGFDVDGIENDFAGDFAGSKSDIFYVDVPMTCTANTGYCSRTFNTGTTCSANEYYGWPEYALNFLTATRPGFNRNLWQHKVVIFPSGSGISCDWVGMGNVGCSSSYCYIWLPQSYAGTLQDYSHELGHNLGLGHSGDARSADSTTQEYGDFSCAMGYCCSTRCYNAPMSAELGWLTPILALTSSNIANQQTITQTITSMSISNRGAVSVYCTWCSTITTYWIQFKTSDNYDRFGNSGWLNNVQIKSKNGAGARADHLWTGSAGSSWSDPSGQLHVSVTGIDLQGKTATVTIKRGSINPCEGVVCTAIDSCHVAGVCDQLTGVCSNPNKPDGSICNDGKPCTTETCVAGTCTVQSILDGCCGNSKCEAGETCSSCSADCISGNGNTAVCGNGRCEMGDGENCLNCPSDCNGVTSGKINTRYCCGSDVGCGDARCTSGKTCTTTSTSFSYCCGDNSCLSPFETTANCYDCKPAVCGDGLCNSGETCSTCPGDCGVCLFCGDGTCNNGETCSTCPGDCGACPCLATGRTCSSGSQCCSNRCTNKKVCA